MADFREKHKTHPSHSMHNLRTRQRETQIEIRKTKRDHKYNAKRVRLTDTEQQEGKISLEETEALCRELGQKGSHVSVECLLKLKQAFTQGPEYIDMLLKIDNCLPSLVGVFTGMKTDLQEQAAYCLTNIATGRTDHALAVAKAAAPYFISYASGSSVLLQDQCAWALGNIAGDSVECRRLLHEQGCIPPLIKLLQSSSPVCQRTAAFALSNLIRDLPEIADDAVKQGILPVVLTLIKNPETNPNVVSEVAWVVTYLLCSDDALNQIMEQQFLPVLVDIVVHDAMTGGVVKDEGEVTTPILRALGNIFTGPNDYCLIACENPRLMPALLKLLECSSLPHVVKECLWVISNMTNDYSVSQSVAYGPILKSLLSQLEKGHDVQIEAMYTLCNMATHGETVCAELVAHGAVAKVVPLLKIFDLELLHMALTFCEMVLRYTANASFMFEECGGVGYLEQLQHHPNSDVQLLAQEIVDNYFGEGEDDCEDVDD